MLLTVLRFILSRAPLPLSSFSVFLPSLSPRDSALVLFAPVHPFVPPHGPHRCASLTHGRSPLARPFSMKLRYRAEGLRLSFSSVRSLSRDAMRDSRLILLFNFTQQVSRSRFATRVLQTSERVRSLSLLFPPVYVVRTSHEPANNRIT